MANDPRYTPYKALNWITPSAMERSGMIPQPSYVNPSLATSHYQPWINRVPPASPQLMGPYDPDDPNSFGKRMSLRQKRARRAMRQRLTCSSSTKTMTKKQKKMRRSYRKMKSYMKNC